MGKYHLIYADPAWSYNNAKPFGGSSLGAVKHYETMTLDQIKSLPVKDLADKDCALFMWAVVPMLPECLSVLEAWGFEYKTSLFWVKRGSPGSGYWFFGIVEVLILGIRGHVKPFHFTFKNVFDFPVGEHSAKPHGFYPIMEQTGLEPRLEMFARHKRQGWDTWGNEVPTATQQLLRLENWR